MATLGEEIFHRLPGAWALERNVPGFGTMTGTAVFSPDEGGALRYREEVAVVTSQGASFDGVREYLYRLTEGGIEIHFADPHRAGELYVRLEFAAQEDDASALGRHHCVDDVYDHRMRWIDGNRFTTEILVSGPKKDYRLDSLYRRLPDRSSCPFSFA